MEEHLPELRQSVSGQRFLYWSLVISIVVGLAAHVGGYAAPIVGAERATRTPG